jgi:glycosyltransferase involved in cell wall biosynthesis
LQAPRGLYYIVPGVNWSLDWDGAYITREIKKQFGLKAKVVSSAPRLSGQLVHYASLWEMAGYMQSRLSERNTIVGTIFHGQRDAPQFREAFEKVLADKEKFARIHTASKIMEKRLIAWGVPAEKLIRIPMGVSLEDFRPAGLDQKAKARRELGIPENVICIGSLHKDGVGKGEGSEPKLIKGPDIFLKVVEKVNRIQPVFVLLSAPARGYVKTGLERLGIPYKHILLNDYLQIPNLYQALDIYLMTSREEGGPKGVLESLATGIPVVATRVGLVPELITSGESGFVAESEDIEKLSAGILQLCDQPGLRQQFSERGLQTIRDYNWPQIAARYYHELYKPILEEMIQ